MLQHQAHLTLEQDAAVSTFMLFHWHLPYFIILALKQPSKEEEAVLTHECQAKVRINSSHAVRQHIHSFAQKPHKLQLYFVSKVVPDRV